MNTFNEKLYYWLSEQACFIKESISQEELFRISINQGDFDDIDYNQETVLKIIQAYTLLSFIVKNHKEELEKLLDYLEPI